MKKIMKVLSAIAAVGLLSGSALGDVLWYKSKVTWAGAGQYGMFLLLYSDSFPSHTFTPPVPSGKYQFAVMPTTLASEVNISRALACSLTSLSAGTYVYAVMEVADNGYGTLSAIYASNEIIP